MSQWVRVLETNDVTPNTSRVVDLGRHELAVFRVGDEFHVLTNICPHSAGPLGEGPLKGYEVRCPWHWWPFDVRTGENELGGKRATTYASRQEEGWLWVELPD